MKQLYAFFLFLVFMNVRAAGGELLVPSATMTVNTNSVCVGGTQPVVTFTGVGTAPFTFIYTINGAPQAPLTTVGSTATVLQATGTAGTFAYHLISVAEATGPAANVTIPDIAVSVTPLPTVSFTSNATANTCSATPVQFTSTVASGTAPFTYEWDFGGDGTSTLANPSHIFNALGCGTETFNVKLKVTDSRGCESAVFSSSVTVKQRPNIEFQDDLNLFDPFSNCSNATAANPTYSITVGNISVSSCINSYSVNWGDSSAVETNITFPIAHTYTQLGAYSMVITAIGTNGCSNSKTYLIKNVSNPSGGIISPGSTQNLCAPTAPIQFTISSWATNSPGTIYEVDYGDGSPFLQLTQAQLIASPQYNAGNPAASTNYPIPHSYLVSSCPASQFIAKLRVTNACGVTAFTADNIIILSQPVASFTSPNNACVNSSVTFNNTTVTGFGQNCAQQSVFKWNFGDGSPIITTPLSAPQNVNHTYASPGTYTVSLTAQNFCGTSTPFTKQICIEGPITPSFTVNNPVGCSPLAVTTTNTTNITGLCNAATYLWEVTYAASNCGSAPVLPANQTTANAGYNFTEPGTYTIKLTMANSCGSFNTTRTVVVKSPPIVSIAAITDICGASSTSINPTATVSNCGSQTPTYSWSFPDGTPSSSASANPGTITYNTAGLKTIKLIVTNECGASTEAVRTFTVKPAPVIGNTNLSQTICSGQQTVAIPLTADITGTTFAWTAVATAGISGFSTPGSGATMPAQTISTSNSNAGTVTYTITPTFNGCAGQPVQYIVNVNPAPAISSQPAASSTCFGSVPPILSVSFSGGSGTPVFEWYSNTNNSSSGGTLINGQTTATYQPPGTSVGTIYYYVKIIFGGGGCSSITSAPAAVTVNAVPVVVSAPQISACSGSQFTFSPASGGGNTIPTGTTYSWTAPSGTGFTGGSAQSNQASVSQTLTNTGNTPVIATYTITPKSGTCTGNPFQLEVMIGPKAVIPAQSAVICSGGTFTVSPVNSGTVIVPTGTVYNWNAPTVSGVSGLAAGSSQASVSGTLTSSTNTPKMVTYAVTPVNSDGSCAGNPFNVVVTVNPVPVLAAITLELCSGSTVFPGMGNTPPDIVPTNTKYTWPAPVIDPPGSITGATASAGQQPIFNPTLTNTSNIPATATYTLTPVAGDCTGADFTITVTVNPKPVVNDISNVVVCNGNLAAATMLSSNSTVATYSWTNNNASIGLAASGTGDIPAFTAQNNGSTPVTATITYKASFGICSGTSKIFTITVNPAPVVTFSTANQVICSGQSTAAVTLGSTTAGATFTWNASTPAGLTGVVSSGTTNIPVQTLVNATSTPITVTYTAEAATSGGATCPGAVSVYTITVDPLPEVTTTPSATVCGGTAFDITIADGSGNSIPAGTTYSWPAPAGTGFLGGSAQTGQPSISQTLLNTTDVQATATYTVTPKSGNCNGAPFTVVVTINPTPKVAPQAQQICSGGSFALNPVSALPNQIVPTGTVYSWPMPLVTGGITGAVPGTDETAITGTLGNPGNTIETATYTITPRTGSCIGQPFTLVVTVNPVPVITTLQQATICSGNAFTVSPANGSGNIVPAGTAYTWPAPVISPPGTISGASASASAQNNISQTLQNTSTLVATATYTVTPAAGSCAGASFEVTVTVNPLPNVAIVPDQELCNGAAVNAVTFTTTVAGTLFKWTNSNPSIGLAASGAGDISSFTGINTGVAPAVATIVVTPEINGCTGTPVSFTVIVNPAPSVTFSQADQAICSSASSTAVSLSSTTPGTTFTWTANVPPGVTGAATSGTNTIPVQQLVNTTNSAIVVTYTAVAATTGISCPGAPAIYTITVNPVPFVNAAQQMEICSGTQPNFIPANTLGTNIPAGTTFTWAVPVGTGFIGGAAQNVPQTSFNQILTNTTLLPVTAVYMITPEFNNCPGVTFQLTVTVNPKAQIASTSVTICTGATFTIDPAAITGAAIPAGTTYLWGIPAMSGVVTGGTSGTGTTVTGTLVNAGTSNETAVYTVTPVSPPGNCTGDAFQVTVNVTPALQVSSTISNYNGFEISTAGANDAFINLTATGGSGTYSYVWSGPGGFTSVSQNIANLGPGNYSVTISDGLCNAVVLTFQIDEPLPLIIQEVIASHTNLKCFGDTDGVIEVQITQVSIAPFDYEIKIQGGAVVESVLDSNLESYIFDNLPAGVYDISVTDANGTIKQLLGIVITQPADALAITNAIISDHNGFSITCTGANNGSIDLTIGGGTPAYTYAWTGPGSFTATTQDLAGLAPGTYSVTVSDTTGACQAIASYDITEPLPITFTHVLSSYNGYQISCFSYNDGNIDLQPSGGTGTYTYVWTGPAGFSATTQDINGLVAGTYTVTITDTNGCINNTGTFILTQPPALNITEAHTDILCFGASTGSIDVTITGGNPIEVSPGIFGYLYAWSGPNGFSSATEDISNVPAGAYTLMVTDISGCTQSATVVLSEPTAINIVIVTTPITCYGDDNATITVTLSGGTGPYTIAWSDFGEGLFRDNLGAGDYLITVTDAMNCVRTLNVNIPQAPLFTVNPVVTQISCFGADDGSINLNFAGGVAPISFAWVDSPTAGVVRNNLGPGTYTVIISDGQPCNITRTFTIIEPHPLTLTAIVTHAFDCTNANSGSVNLIVSGGVGPYTYSWSNGMVTEDLSAVGPGDYHVTVTDANNCVITSQYTVNRHAPLIANVVTKTEFDCATRFVKQTFIAQVTGGVPPYVLNWSSGSVSGFNGEIMETAQNGTVILDVTDSMGCLTNYTFNVDIPELGTPSFESDSYAYLTFGTYSIVDPIQFTNTATGDYESISWDFGDGAVSTEENPVHSFQREGQYVVVQTVTYPFGCVYTFIRTLDINKGYELMMPSAFTPNNDVINDNFSPVFRGLKSVRIDVYTTWGEMIYSEEGETMKGWDGTIKGAQAENGNYYYKVEAITFYGTVITREGPFTLIK